MAFQRILLAAGILVAPQFAGGSWVTETLSFWTNSLPGWSSPSPSPSHFDYVPLLEFYELNYRELVKDDLPVKACTSQSEPAPLWKRPFVHSRLRLIPDGWPEPNLFGVLPTTTLHQTLPPTGFCKWLGALEIPYVSWMVTSSWFCEDCSERPCAKAVGFVPGTHELTVDFPPGGSYHGDACVWVDKLPPGARKMRVSWEQQVDRWVLVRLLVGAILVWNYVSFRESAALHSAMGGSGWLFVLVAMVSVWFYSSARSAINGNIPLGSLFTTLGMLMCVLVPSMGQAFVSVVAPSSATDVWAWLNFSIYSVPVGWIVFFTTVVVTYKTISFGARSSLMYFASAPEPEGDVLFDIGSDGRRIDLNLPSTPLPQRCLGSLIWLGGFVLLLQSTYSEPCSFALTLAVLLKDLILDILTQGCRRVRGGDHFGPCQLQSHLISMDAYEAEGKMHTVRALAQLRNLVRQEPQLYGTGREDSELRMRRFCDGHERFGNWQFDDGKVHNILERERRLSGVPNPFCDEFHPEPSRRWCSIM